jgi:predicted CoA-binding protein
MQVPDALSRCENVKADVVESPVEDDLFMIWSQNGLYAVSDYCHLDQAGIACIQCLSMTYRRLTGKSNRI